MPLTKEQLLAPRRRVKDKYPSMELEPFHVGQIITLTWHEEDGWIHVPLKHIPGSYMRQAFFDEFPNIFESLPWWSDRKPEDMPLFIKEVDSLYKIGEVVKVKEWVLENEESDCPCFQDEKDNHYTWVRGFEPATEEEYTTYVNQKQQ